MNESNLNSILSHKHTDFFFILCHLSFYWGQYYYYYYYYYYYDAHIQMTSAHLHMKGTQILSKKFFLCPGMPSFVNRASSTCVVYRMKLERVDHKWRLFGNLIFWLFKLYGSSGPSLSWSSLKFLIQISISRVSTPFDTSLARVIPIYS